MGGCGPVWKPAWCPGNLLVRSHNPFSAALATVPGLGARQPLQLVRKRSSAFADGSRNACYRAQLVREPPRRLGQPPEGMVAIGSRLWKARGELPLELRGRPRRVPDRFANGPILVARELASLFRLSENLHHFEGRRADGGVICRHPSGLVLVEE